MHTTNAQSGHPACDIENLHKTSYPNEEVNCNEPSLSVSVLCLGVQLYVRFCNIICQCKLTFNIEDSTQKDIFEKQDFSFIINKCYTCLWFQ